MAGIRTKEFERHHSHGKISLGHWPSFKLDMSKFPLDAVFEKKLPNNRCDLSAPNHSRPELGHYHCALHTHRLMVLADVFVRSSASELMAECGVLLQIARRKRRNPSWQSGTSPAVKAAAGSKSTVWTMTEGFVH